MDSRLLEDTLLEDTLRHLAALVVFDTRNPPRAIAAEGGLFDYLRGQLPGFRLELRDHGAGSVSLLAIRGAPRLLFNAHMDTVPAAPGWGADPLALRVEGERAIGLGACDIKGAAAGLLAAAAASDGDAAFLFTSDEEANDARGVPAFLAGDHGFDAVVVAEPTRCEAVLAHRGIHSVALRFAGEAGHASSADALRKSALHRMLRWGGKALALVDAERDATFDGLVGLRFNIGRIEGGIKANVIAPDADVRLNFRPLPTHDVDALHAALRACAAEGDIADYRETFRGPSLPAGDVVLAPRRRDEARRLAESLRLPVGPAVDFWTEASLFSQAGLTALVYGPGDIAQAHAVDEWVSLDQLQRYAASIHRILRGDRA